MRNTNIEWADHTFNPWEGCTKVSPGCAHCYAEARNSRFNGGTAPNWGTGAPRRRTSAQNWNQLSKWNAEAKGAFRKPRVFCASLADWLDPEVPVEWLAELLAAIRAALHLDFLLLTKRPELFWERVSDVANSGFPDPLARLGAGVAMDWIGGRTPPPNVWIGTTVEDQQRADERIPALLKIPARVRFLSCEPLLAPIDLRQKLYASRGDSEIVGYRWPAGIDWVICGGESGSHARPMHPDWARSLRDQCQAAGVAFFFKQWGEWAVCHPSADAKSFLSVWADGRVMSESEWYAHCKAHGPEGGRAKDWSAHAMCRVGKASAGRLLDGVEWSQFPAERKGTTGGAS